MPYSQKQWQDRIKDAQGNIVQEGTPFSAGNMNRMEQGIADAHAQLEEAGRQKQTLIQGVSVLNGAVDAPVNIEIEGRTLIPMQNTVLDPLKYYVLADKRTKIKWADATIQQGIYKFIGKAERPTLIRVANFEGKVSGSTLENPHRAKTPWSSVTTLVSPSEPKADEATSTDYNTKLSTLNGTNWPVSINIANNIAQQLFSFDLIAEVERQLGRIPRTTVADKVQWLKDNVAKITANWHGFGSGPSGYRAALEFWYTDTNQWFSQKNSGTLLATHVNGTVAKLGPTATTITDKLDTNGLFHILAHAPVSDGVTPSIINTDYVELEIELKPEAILHAPRVPLYEVTQAHYDAINVTMLEDEILRRYPSVEGVTHLQNPYVMAEGENLLPPLYEWGVSTGGALTMPYEANYDGAITQTFYVDLLIPAGTTVTLSHEAGEAAIYQYGSSSIAAIPYRTSAKTYTIPAGQPGIRVYGRINASATLFKNPILTLGATEKPFTPQNKSYALFETKLGKIGIEADRIFEKDGKYFKRKAIEDVVLDGSLTWAHFGDATGFKTVRLASVVNPFTTHDVDTSEISSYNGSLLKFIGSMASNILAPNQYLFRNDVGIYISISDSESGWNETYAPTTDEIKAYFNGWKVKTADGANKPTAWVSIVDGTDAPTQTLAYVAANKAANYTPYKLSYVLSPSRVEEIKAEGAISVNGLTIIEVGSGVIMREKLVATSGGDGLVKTNITSLGGTNFKQRASKILSIYKNGLKDGWTIYNSSIANGVQAAYIQQERYDATAEYTVTYVVYDRQPFTANPVNVSAQFANNVRSALEDTTKKVEDVKTETSVNSLILYDVLKRLKAGGL